MFMASSVVDDVAIAALYDLQFSEPIIKFIHVLQQHRRRTAEHRDELPHMGFPPV